MSLASVPWRARRLSLIALALAALLVGGAPPASVATLRVCPSGCAFDNLPAALAAAANGDTIRMAAGDYATGGFVINKNVRLRGAGADQTTILGDGRIGFGPAVLVGTGGSATIEGVTIKSGFFEPGTFGAGGILNLVTLTRKASTVTRKSSSDGSGIDNAGTLTLTGSTVSGNVPDDCFGC